MIDKYKIILTMITRPIAILIGIICMFAIAIAKPYNYYNYNSTSYSTPNTSSNDNLVPMKVTRFTSGTGFFVDYQHIITNEHVVNSCNHIRIRGAVEPSYAKLVAIDHKNDLALLVTNNHPVRPALLRGEKNIKIGENVSVLGYPLKSGITGKYVVKYAQVTDTSMYSDVPGSIQFTDTVEKGNSGGPLMDSSGTVVGVVVGKMSFYPLDQKGHKINTPIKTSSIAIGLQKLKEFLDKFNVQYYTNDVAISYDKPYMEAQAKQYIVNVHCIKSETNEYTNKSKEGSFEIMSLDENNSK